MPARRACITASQAAHSNTVPPTRRSEAGSTSQAAAPARNTQALANTQKPPTSSHTNPTRAVGKPAYQLAAHSTAQAAPVASAAVGP